MRPGKTPRSKKGRTRKAAGFIDPQPAEISIDPVTGEPGHRRLSAEEARRLVEENDIQREVEDHSLVMRPPRLTGRLSGLMRTNPAGGRPADEILDQIWLAWRTAPDKKPTWRELARMYYCAVSLKNRGVRGLSPEKVSPEEVLEKVRKDSRKEFQRLRNEYDLLPVSKRSSREKNIRAYIRRRRRELEETAKVQP